MIVDEHSSLEDHIQFAFVEVVRFDWCIVDDFLEILSYCLFVSSHYRIVGPLLSQCYNNDWFLICHFLFFIELFFYHDHLASAIMLFYLLLDYFYKPVAFEKSYFLLDVLPYYFKSNLIVLLFHQVLFLKSLQNFETHKNLKFLCCEHFYEL